MITLGCGNNLPGMTDLDMVDQLYHYINGGIKKVRTFIVISKTKEIKYATVLAGKIGREKFCGEFGKSCVICQST